MACSHRLKFCSIKCLWLKKFFNFFSPRKLFESATKEITKKKLSVWVDVAPCIYMDFHDAVDVEHIGFLPWLFFVQFSNCSSFSTLLRSFGILLRLDGYYEYKLTVKYDLLCGT